jgi:ABC-type transport system involved in multi-copper enzyme maturation permease subunit
MHLVASVRAGARLVLLAARTVGGRRVFLLPLVPVAWPALLAVFAAMGGNTYTASAVPAFLVGLPLGVLAIALGVRVVGGEVDARTLEIVYTVPGGAGKVFVARFVASALVVALALLPLALVVFVVFTSYDPRALFAALQAALVHLALATYLGALLRGTITAAMAATPVFALSVLSAGSGLRISPFFNPVQLARYDPSDVLAWTVQNRIGMALLVVALVALALSRAERREAMLSG